MRLGYWETEYFQGKLSKDFQQELGELPDTYSNYHLLAPVVQTLDTAIHRINHCPADKHYENQLRYPLDSDLSGG